MNGFAFLEYEEPDDAEEAVSRLHGKDLDGRRLNVELSHGKGGLSRRDEPAGSGKRGGRIRGNRQNCILVKGLSERTTWKELKDFARTAGNVEYTDIWDEGGQKLGVIKYTCRSDFKHAIKNLDDTKCDGKYVRVQEDRDDHEPSFSRSRSRGRRSRSRSRSPKKRSRSPKKRSRTPQKKRSRTPEKKRSRSRSYKKRSRTPEKKRSRSPEKKRNKSPQKRSRSPEKRSRSPK